jgi:DNA-binding beta-propeller fold protein YncE
VANSGSDTVTPISLRTDTAGPAITVGAFPGGIAITPDGNPAYP